MQHSLLIKCVVWHCKIMLFLFDTLQCSNRNCLFFTNLSESFYHLLFGDTHPFVLQIFFPSNFACDLLC